MKELSIEEKAKVYDGNYKAYTELINRLEDVKEAIKKQNYGIAMNILFKPYPEHQIITSTELKESEDERIRKWLIEMVEEVRKANPTNAEHNGRCSKAIAWLEKQSGLMKALQISNARIGELIEENYYLKEKQGEQKPSLIIPKFRVGDEIKTSNEESLTITKIDEKGYWSEDLFVCSFEDSAKWGLVEQKPVDNGESNLLTVERAKEISPFMRSGFENESNDKVETKFKVGDIITNGKIIGKVDENENNKYHGWFGYDKDLSVHYADIPDIENWHKWTIQDAEAGDVLVTINKNIFIFKSISDCTIYDYCGLYFGEFVEFSATVNGSAAVQLPIDYTPATKEQRDTLEKAMADAGYTFDFEKKELRKIEQNPAWSEEDENINQSIIDILTKQGFQTQVNWLKSLKERVQPKQEWSEEDYNEIETIACHLDNIDNEGMAEVLRNIRDKYYHTIPQSTWKPSDEHYELEEFAKIVRGNLTGISKAVQELFKAKYLQLTGNKMYGGYKD